MGEREKAEYLARCRASGCDDELAETMLGFEIDRRTAVAADEWLAGIVEASRARR